ncbi:unnamed protein product [Thlaspi arvense]|uniref:MATH domain-containing protein n=1 Tax=Thlaspi arvense TaxID=13288 RepID=A0AAU9SCN6_THLAR|nr:unnamed protein product [Thlaspi arvense]
MEDINGVPVLASQVESVNRMLEKHPEIATSPGPKIQQHASILMCLIDMLTQSIQGVSKDDLADADASLAYLLNVGYKLQWLEKNLKTLSDKKEKEEAGVDRLQGIEEELKCLKQKRSNLEAQLEKENRMQEVEEELNDLKQKCLNVEAELEKVKADVAMARAPLTYDDIQYN